MKCNSNYFGDYKLVITEEKNCYCIHHNKAKMKASLIGNLLYDDFVDFINNNLQITNIYRKRTEIVEYTTSID
jgi:hypothetical protein